MSHPQVLIGLHPWVQALPNKLALIVNHENITSNWYVGNDRSMLVCNCLFRLGGAGALLSNRSAAPPSEASILHYVSHPIYVASELISGRSPSSRHVQQP